MARYKPIGTGMKLLPVDLSRQLLPGTFEHARSHLLGHEMDLRPLDARFRNGEGGAPACAPAVLLKVILYAYSRGMIRSRDIARACQENVTFMALSGGSLPHFTPVAAFVRELKNEIANLFTQVLFLCEAQGLSGREMFATDGVKLPSHASKSKSGTRAEFKGQAGKIEAGAKKMPGRHRQADDQALEPHLAGKDNARIERLKQDAAQLREWLEDNPEDRRGAKGSIRKSNRTDNDSAKMATSKGVIQGYTGVAAVDARCQVIAEAQAHGTGSEHALLVPVIEAFRDLIEEDSLITADAG